MPLPSGAETIPRGTGVAVSIAADGRTLVYLGQSSDGARRAYVRRLGEVGSSPVPGTVSMIMPVVSPDGDWLAVAPVFGAISLTMIDGGELFSLCGSCNDPAWGDDGNLYYIQGGALWRRPPAGGDPELMVEPLPEQGLPYMTRPDVLPGSAAAVVEVGNYAFGGIAVVRFEDRRVVHVATDGSNPYYSPTGHVVFPRRGTLFAAPFDRETMEVGEPEPVLRNVRVENAGAVQLSLADDGTLVFSPADSAPRAQLVWVDRDGEALPITEQRKNYQLIDIAPDGAGAAVGVNDNGSRDIWIVDLQTGAQRQLTTVGTAASPVWSPDGSSIAFGVEAADSFAIWRMQVVGGAIEELHSSEVPLRPMAWTPDGTELVFLELSATQDIVTVDLSDGTTSQLTDTAALENGTTLSADGTLLAYESDRTGIRQIYARRFPTGADVQVSIDDGLNPVWSAAGSELIYRSLRSTRLHTARIRAGAAVEVIDRAVLFSPAPYWIGLVRASFDVAADGRMLMVRHRDPDDPPDRLHVIQNFSERLRSITLDSDP